MGSVRHALGAACNDDVRIAGYDCLGTDDEGFDRGGAYFVYGRGDSGFGEACAKGDLASWVLTEAGSDG